MAKRLSYQGYYHQQMTFIDRYIRGKSTPSDQERVARIAALQNQQTRYFLPDFLAIEAEHELDTTKIGYKPIEGVTYLNEETLLAPQKGMIREEIRRLSRYRLVYGSVDFYLENQIETRTSLDVISTCPPNLMGTSASDLEEFSTGKSIENRQIKIEPYQLECQKLADFIVSLAAAKGNERLIMPPFGCGIILQTLNKKSQEIADRLMYTAFAEAAIKYKINIDWVVWHKTPRKSEQMRTQFAQYCTENIYMQPIIGELVQHASDRQEKGERIALLNPVGDRFIGGLYTRNNLSIATIEEQIAQQSDLLLLHTTLNSSLVERFYQDFHAQKAYTGESLVEETVASDAEILMGEGGEELDEITPLIRSPNTIPLINVAKQINHLYCKIDDVPEILQIEGNYKISFSHRHSAVAFADGMLLLGMENPQRPGQRKAIKLERNTQVVDLSAEQFSDLVIHLQESLNEEFRLQLTNIKTKAQILRDRGHINAADVAEILHKSIQQTLNDYCEGKMGNGQFNRMCNNAINLARPILETHRGWKKTLGNLSLAIIGLGVGYIIGGLINLAITGNFLFFKKTETSRYVDHLQNTVNNLERPAGKIY